MSEATDTNKKDFEKIQSSVSSQPELVMKTNWNNKINLALWLITFVASVAVDQLTKFWAKTHLTFNQQVEVIPNILNFRLLYNTGAAFSAMNEQTGILTVISFLASIALIVYSLKQIKGGNKLLLCALALITAGAVGNLIDRAFLGQVTDFIDLLLLPGNFPVFNVADSIINLGAGLYMIDLLLNKKLLEKRD